MSTPRIALQLYSVRHLLAAELDATLARVAELGFTAVEVFDFVERADELAAALRRHGLTAVTGHATLATLPIQANAGDPSPPSPDAVFAAAATLGLQIVIDPFSSPDRWTTAHDIAHTAALLNAAAEVAATNDLRAGYHNHAHELQIVDDRHAIEVFADELDSEVVLELDLYWASVGGADVVALIDRLGRRVAAVHVKDGTLEPEKSSATPPQDQVPAGTGVVDLAAALAAATSLDYAIVEFDHYCGDVVAAIAASRDWLADRLD